MFVQVSNIGNNGTEYANLTAPNHMQFNIGDEIKCAFRGVVKTVKIKKIRYEFTDDAYTFVDNPQHQFLGKITLYTETA